MELNFKPGKFALNRDTLETVIVKEVDGDRILVILMDGVTESWKNKKEYNLFRRKNNKWVIEGPPIVRSGTEMDEMQGNNDRTNISERFK
tara:strand:- start:937 stop:1206 length:270 start_codon:yes stop_codon:yes gene_type:complete